ncbi:NACHT domain-containing protein [Vibrio diabolicus]|uniref:NACHT domain-containing protein n=1 Tax=Vibrio diabolicus TaxID=50719 RepID=UPI00160CD408|nr:NACHT domain-containing protein [Vibrio diabolicus]
MSKIEDLFKIFKAEVDMSGLAEKGALELSKSAAPLVVKWFSSIAEEYKHICKNTFLRLIETQYRELNLTTSILSGTNKVKINEIYVPLTLSSSSLPKEYVINNFPKKLLKTHNKIMISDSAGMGKSTILKMLFRYTIEQASILPFYIDLKSLIKENDVISIESYILENYPSFTEEPSINFIRSLISKNPYLFLFDGADEVPDSKKEKVFNVINVFSKKAKNSNFVIASRKEDKIISAFPNFEVLNINPLEIEESEELLLKCGKDKEVSARLISELKKPQNERVLEFLGNPLLTTLLQAAYQHKKKIPLKKNLFFSQIYDALFEDHDSNKPGVFTREIKSGLTINEFEEVLAAFAYDGRPKETLEYSKNELNRFFQQFSDSHPTITFKSSNFIEDLIVSVPVLKRDGLTYAWQHKSLQEYFFVRHITSYIEDISLKKEVISRISKSNSSMRYKLVLDMLYDEEKTTFHDTATRNLQEFINKNSNKEISDEKLKGIDLFNKYYIGTSKSVAKDWGVNYSVDATHKFFMSISNSKKSKELQKQGFFLSSVSYSMSGKVVLEFSNPMYTLVEVLSEKGEHFTRELNFSGSRTEEAQNNKERKIKQIDDLPNANEVLLELGACYYINQVELNEFMNEFDKKYLAYNMSSCFIPEF